MDTATVNADVDEKLQNLIMELWAGDFSQNDFSYRLVGPP